MTYVAKFLSRTLAASTVGAAALLWSGNIPMTGNASLVSSAEALVGAPATPRSFAGVARRTTRRAVAVGTVAVGATALGVATVRAATVAPIVTTAPAPRCVRIIGPYGRAATVCR